MQKKSLNNRFIVESYKEDRALKASIQNGFAMVAQKTTLKGLKLLVDAEVNSTVVPAGSIVYIREEYLQSQPWAKKVFTCSSLPEDFIIVEGMHVEFWELA